MLPRNQWTSRSLGNDRLKVDAYFLTFSMMRTKKRWIFCDYSASVAVLFDTAGHDVDYGGERVGPVSPLQTASFHIVVDTKVVGPTLACHRLLLPLPCGREVPQRDEKRK